MSSKKIENKQNFLKKLRRPTSHLGGANSYGQIYNPSTKIKRVSVFWLTININEQNTRKSDKPRSNLIPFKLKHEQVALFGTKNALSCKTLCPRRGSQKSEDLLRFFCEGEIYCYYNWHKPKCFYTIFFV